MTTTVTDKKLSPNEELKSSIPTLSGNIYATIADESVDHFSAEDIQFLKFHGSYQQDDRDLRKTGKKYIMMVRGRIPGGVMTAKQWCVFDELATQYGNNTLRLTTRQSIQFHGVVKSNLRPLIKRINESLLSTLSACGDITRNVMAPPTPAYTRARDQVYADAHEVARALAPRTKAYHSIWIDGVQLDNEAPENKEFEDPLYGKAYLPRKFKVAFAVPPVNDIDVLTNCLGFIAIVENDQVVGYNVCVGGSMGRSHGNAATYPRIADVLGFITPDKVVNVAKAVLTIHRDFGDRVDRKHARLKYVIAERGAAWARNEVNQRAGTILAPARPFKFTSSTDLLGWRQAVDGKWFFGMYVNMGRVKDAQKAVLRQVAEQFPNLEFRITPNQNVILVNADATEKSAISALLQAAGLKPEQQTSPLRATALACPALPTCGLALAESERMLPGVIDRIEKICDDLGLSGEEIIVRSTGCPNGCARPYMAELAFVGKGPGRYQVWLGGNAAGTRLNRLWKDVVKEADLETELRPLFVRFATERNPEERFGDWCDRTLWTETATPH
ncbi:MAG TPA: NADPH-dependent assimilatory sulfite reductase hemoprotein subunit [Verrucomicrobiota bacterium]|nr:NADPH-dependent assimilatory sulfite reductase hemoprotein subunit [Verrucomicrobiota bacterium]HNT13981.1 NADPH-dependent assimilatory sulfite reductase hemoprotein subunit [Verrucomicrobiota bacterium]